MEQQSITGHVCEECGQPANEYRITMINEDGSDAIFHYCDEHVKNSGFCIGCHHFVAGSDDDRGGDLCAQCIDEMRYELGEYDEPDDYFIY